MEKIIKLMTFTNKFNMTTMYKFVAYFSCKFFFFFFIILAEPYIGIKIISGQSNHAFFQSKGLVYGWAYGWLSQCETIQRYVKVFISKVSFCTVRCDNIY